MKLLSLFILLGTIWVTGYLSTGNRAASGVWPYPGSAACPSSFPFGAQLHLTGAMDITVTCEDRTPGDPWLVDVFVGSRDEAFKLTGQYSYDYLG